MSEELHGQAEPEAPAPAAPVGSDPERAERARRAAETRRKKKELRERKQRLAAERRAAKERASETEKAGGAESAGGDEGAAGVSPEVEDFVREQFERPLRNADELAMTLGKLQMTLCGAAQGTAFEDAAWSLQWTNGEKPLPRCAVASRMMWPWMKRNGIDVYLAEQADTVLFGIGLVVLFGPSIGPVRDAWKKRAAAKAAQQTTEAETTPAAAPAAEKPANVHNLAPKSAQAGA